MEEPTHLITDESIPPITRDESINEILSGDEASFENYLKISHLLAHIATKLYGLTTREAIYETIIEEFRALPKAMTSIIEVAPDGKTGIMAYSSLTQGLIRNAETFTGLSRRTALIPIARSQYYRKIVEQRTVVCLPSEKMFIDVLPLAVKKLSAALVKLFRLRNLSISAPLCCGDRVVGILGISSPGIVLELEDNVRVLAHHISSALEFAEQFQARQKAENELKAALHEKEVMLREIHHRVKNNLQIISSMLSLHGRRHANVRFQTALKEIRGKVDSIAVVHTELYQSDDLATINLASYLQKMASQIGALFYTDTCNPSLLVSSPPIKLTVTQAIPCGLVVNELIINALKHAFPEDFGKRPEITVSVEHGDDDTVAITVHDNGTGLPEGFDLAKDANLGFEIVKLLAENQLGGTLKYGNDGGLKTTVSFTLGR